MSCKILTNKMLATLDQMVPHADIIKVFTVAAVS